MFRNHLHTAWRHFQKYRTTALLNISGLTLGVAVCLLITVWLQRELSYDKFHPGAESIFRAYNTFKSESESFTQAPSATGIGAQLPKHIASITAASRVFRNSYMLKVGDTQFSEEGVSRKHTVVGLFRNGYGSLDHRIAYRQYSIGKSGDGKSHKKFAYGVSRSQSLQAVPRRLFKG